MCKVCTEAVDCVALWTRVTLGLGMCKVCTEGVDCVALWTRVTLGLDMCKVCNEAVHMAKSRKRVPRVSKWTKKTFPMGNMTGFARVYMQSGPKPKVCRIFSWKVERDISCWIWANFACFRHCLFSVWQTCNLKPGQGQRRVAQSSQGWKPPKMAWEPEGDMDDG